MLPMRTLLALLLLASIPACPKPQGAIPAPATSSGAERMIIRVNPAQLTWLPDEVVFAEDSDVQKASYRVFHFDRADFEARVGKLGQVTTKAITVEITAQAPRVVPRAEGTPAPEGGIQVIDYRCRVAP
jgi:hypothetical protein